MPPSVSGWIAELVLLLPPVRIVSEVQRLVLTDVLWDSGHSDPAAVYNDGDRIRRAVGHRVEGRSHGVALWDGTQRSVIRSPFAPVEPIARLSSSTGRACTGSTGAAAHLVACSSRALYVWVPAHVTVFALSRTVEHVTVVIISLRPAHRVRVELGPSASSSSGKRVKCRSRQGVVRASLKLGCSCLCTPRRRDLSQR